MSTEGVARVDSIERRLQSGRPAPSGLAGFATLLRVGSVRYASYYFIAFEAGVIQAGGSALHWALPAVALCIGNCVAVELVNRHSDRVADEVNRPERTALCHRIGYDVIRRDAFVLWAALAALYIGWFAVERDLALFATQAVAWFVGWNYSVGLRFKERRYGVFVVLASTFVLPYLFGWATSAELSRATLAFLCIPFFIASLSGIKDVTDEAGDLTSGYRSAFLALIRRRSAARLLLLLGSPYLLVFVLIGLDLATARLAWLTVLAPASLLFAVIVRNTASNEEAMAARECMYQFWFVLIAASVWLMHPSWPTSAVIGGAAAFWVVTSRHLHWMPGLQLQQIVLCLRVVARAHRRARWGEVSS